MFIVKRQGKKNSTVEESYVEKLIEPFKTTKTSPVPPYPSVEYDARREGGNIALLLILGITRPDTSHATQSFAAVSHDAFPRHWNAVMQTPVFEGDLGLGLGF